MEQGDVDDRCIEADGQVCFRHLTSVPEHNAQTPPPALFEAPASPPHAHSSPLITPLTPHQLPLHLRRPGSKGPTGWAAWRPRTRTCR